jgi:hypothetical protein
VKDLLAVGQRKSEKAAIFVSKSEQKMLKDETRRMPDVLLDALSKTDMAGCISRQNPTMRP